MMTRISRVIAIAALFAFAIGTISAVIAGDWRVFILAVLGGAAVAFWARPAR